MMVSELLDEVLSRVGSKMPATSISIYTAINAVTDVVFKRLWSGRSEMAVAELQLTVPAGKATVILPDDFRGFNQFPHISVDSGATWKELLPIAPRERYSFSTQNQTPTHYELRNILVQLYPPPDKQTLFRADYFQQPDRVSTLDDEIPFEGFLDHVYLEGVVYTITQGSTVLFSPQFEEFVRQMVDQAVTFRNRKDITWRTLA